MPFDSTTLPEGRRAALELADFIESEKFAFDYIDPIFEPSCKSAGCIGGHAAALWPDVRSNPGASTTDFREKVLAERLGMSERQLGNLCFNMPVGKGRARADAVAVLRHYAATGVVDWDTVDDMEAACTR